MADQALSASELAIVATPTRRRYLGFKRTILLDRKRLVALLDLHQYGTLSHDNFEVVVRLAHEKMSQPSHHRVIELLLIRPRRRITSAQIL